MAAAISGAAFDVERTFDGSRRQILVPLERMQRERIGKHRPYLTRRPTTAEIDAFGELRASEGYTKLRRALRTYVAGTIHDPVRLQGLWSLSVRPRLHGAKDRVCTVSVGGTETLIVLDTTWLGPVVRMNVADGLGLSESLETAEGLIDLWHTAGYYSITRHCPIRAIRLQSGYNFDAYDSVLGLLKSPRVLDAAYRLNAHLMGYGGTTLSRSHSRPFADDVLR